MQCFDSFVLSAITHFSASVTKIFLQLISVEFLTTGIHHQCLYSTYSSVWEFSSYSVLKWQYVLIYIIKVWGGENVWAQNALWSLEKCRKMHFQLAPHRGGLHLIRNSKIKVNFILRLHLHLTSLNCKQNLSVEDIQNPFHLSASGFQAKPQITPQK